MSSFPVRPATSRDAKAIAEIHAKSARAAYQGLVPDEQLNVLSSDKREQFWREAIQYMEPQVQVATADDKVIGFVGFDRSRDKGTPSTTGEIWSIYVDPAFWEKGVGVALWDAANDGLKEEGCTKVTVWVPVRNDRGLRFHELAGFKREMTSLKTVAVGSVKLEEIRLKRDVG
ncbi:MAG TPA: GNAT family N-acetyltransferase [Polaromonas sp.]|uniref:GNAT family N-acetyltransferase n=1 Tax=Polaromonas sp. TaxID=1869339 RepID=UPI002D4CF973|nr:GNAT family N-acetyltransferase [Polaromonas sp.]HYW56592.1 GNAT family N-acetyltransferase [Polaromonas sp.]